jgi:hypothetical protein
MKTAIQPPENSHRQAKPEAASCDGKLKDPVEEGVRLALGASPTATRHPNLADLMKHALGVVESGVLNLGSNPEHLKTFGR